MANVKGPCLQRLSLSSSYSKGDSDVVAEGRRDVATDSPTGELSVPNGCPDWTCIFWALQRYFDS